MLVQWMKRSSSTRVHTRSPSFTDNNHHHNNHPPQTTPFHSPSPIHKHSVSFKDIESLLSNSPNYPSSPLSLKDIHTLFSDPDPPTRIHPSIFHRARAWAQRQTLTQPQTQTQTQTEPPDCQNKVVIYYTGLRVVRRTYEDCRAVRWMLKGYGVKLDERDLSMDSSYVDELVKVVGGERKEKVVKMLPLVYVNGKCIGGVEEIRRLHECGELKKVLSTVPRIEKNSNGGGGGGYGGGCEVCGGCRYVVCEYCDGSHKVFVGKIDGFRSCSVCNVNGLVKCPCCTSALLF